MQNKIVKPSASSKFGGSFFKCTPPPLTHNIQLQNREIAFTFSRAHTQFQCMIITDIARSIGIVDEC